MFSFFCAGTILVGENQEAFHQQVTATLVNGRMVFRDLNKVVFECDLQGCVVGKVKTKTKAQFLDKGYADVILVDLKVPTSEQLQKWTIYIGGDAGAEARLLLPYWLHFRKYSMLLTR